MAENVKLPLPNFLKLLTSNNISAPKAIAIAGKIYKDFNTPAQIAWLTDSKLKGAGVDSNEERKLVLKAMRQAGYISSAKSKQKIDTAHDSPHASTSTLSAVEAVTTPKKRKRTIAASEKNEFLPDGPIDEASEYGSLEFNEVLDEDVLQTKATVVNRAPLMTAWATIVAERLGFQREEALSIASSYTEMNAISKGVSLGIYKQGKQKGLEAAKGGTQPYVDLMGRRPLYQTHRDHWRALHNGAPTQPSSAFAYISRSLRQTTPFIIGALRLLADSFGCNEINDKAWNLYRDFRPSVEGWGERAEVRCATILGLRKPPEPENKLKQEQVLGPQKGNGTLAANLVKYEAIEDDQELAEAPESKRPRTLEEYEAALDEDHTFDDVDLNVT